jgi:beta-glucosidase
MGGWESPEVIEAFAYYAATVAQVLGNRVTWWMTFNEPSIFVNSGYRTAKHPPFRMDDEVTICRVSRGVLLAHGMAVQAIRAHAEKTPRISLALTGTCFTPLSFSGADQEAARHLTFHGGLNSFNYWADPVYLGKSSAPLDGFLSEEDWKIIYQPLDWFGFNIYHSVNYADDPNGNPLFYPGIPRTMKKWPITPEVLYWLPVMLHERYGLPVMVTENGIANIDFMMLDGKVHDPQRSDFIKRYLGCLKLAAEDGVPILGYTYWSLHDNWEWAGGCDYRFGLLFIDYRTGERLIKDSGYDYAKIIKTNGWDLPDMRKLLV